MEMTPQVIKDINKAIVIIAEDYSGTKQYDDEGHAFDMRWDDCVEHANEDFQRDVKRYMECMGYELSDSDSCQIATWANDNINSSTLVIYE